MGRHTKNKIFCIEQRVGSFLFRIAKEYRGMSWKTWLWGSWSTEDSVEVGHTTIRYDNRGFRFMGIQFSVIKRTYHESV